MRPKIRSPTTPWRSAAVRQRFLHPGSAHVCGANTFAEHLPWARRAHHEHCVSPACEPSPAEEGLGFGRKWVPFALWPNPLAPLLPGSSLPLLLRTWGSLPPLTPPWAPGPASFAWGTLYRQAFWLTNVYECLRSSRIEGNISNLLNMAFQKTWGCSQLAKSCLGLFFPELANPLPGPCVFFTERERWGKRKKRREGRRKERRRDCEIWRKNRPSFFPKVENTFIYLFIFLLVPGRECMGANVTRY